jgi:hypothetical protein
MGNEWAMGSTQLALRNGLAFAFFYVLLLPTACR